MVDVRTYASTIVKNRPCVTFCRQREMERASLDERDRWRLDTNYY